MSILRSQMEIRLLQTVKGFLGFIQRKCIGWIFIIVLFSCSTFERKPDDILSKQEMVKVLAEIYILEEKANHLALPSDSAHQVFEAMRQTFFESTGVADTAFKKSFDYYMDRPIEMEEIYTILVDSLQLREQRAPTRPQEQ